MAATTSADGDWLVALLTATLAITGPTSPFMLWLATHQGDVVAAVRGCTNVDPTFARYVEAVVSEAIFTHGAAARTAIANVLAAAEEPPTQGPR
jgi:hypothetical protein